MTYEELVLEALTYRRHVGAHPDELRLYIELREETPHTSSDDVAVLLKLREEGKVTRTGTRWHLTNVGYRQARGPALKPEWKDEDSWILLAVLFCTQGGEGTLDRIIGAADFINHAIPTLEELHGALNRLYAGRLITWCTGAAAPTDDALSLLRKAETKPRQGVYTTWQRMRRLLECPCCGVSLTAVRWRILIDDAALQQGYEKYVRTLRGT